jgi:Cu(I)/Ag(I) efflux system membrane fusion protein
MKTFSKVKKLILVLVLLVAITSCGRRDVSHEGRIAQQEEVVNIAYYTCGMHPSVRISPEEYNKGNVNCPICNMKLTPVYTEESGTAGAYYGCGVDTEGKCPHCDLGKADAECICGEHSFLIKGQKMECPVCSEPLKKLTQEEVDKLKGAVSRVKIKGEQARLAGVETESVSRHHLHKEIRTVGKVAYDPYLAITQEEFISSLKALDRINEGGISEIKERAANLAESSKRKLRLLGLSDKQIKELENTREIQTSLILPEEKMWIYGDVYEYEMSWVKSGEKVKVTTSSLPGEEFQGVISSVNPVLDPKTRSVTFRAEIDNPGLKLKPEMYVDVVIMSMYVSPSGEHMVLAVPKDAVLDTGVRKIVWLDVGSEEYEGRIVELGPEATAIVDGRSARFYPVLKGLSEGEKVVTKANFLIDSQSQITGVAAGAYSGAIGTEEGPKAPPVHQH